MKTILKIFLLFSTAFLSRTSAQNPYGEYPLAHTYSIVARDAVTGDLGVAVQSHWFSVGSIVSWGEPGVGVVATQSFVNASFGNRALNLLKEGMSPQQVVDSLIASDDGRDMRQLAVLDYKGRAAAYTGKLCIPFAGHIVGENFSVQANLMKSNTVWPAMEEAFKKSVGQPLAERMLAALKAAQNEGGDIRGQQSAAILVVKGTSSGKIWEDKIVDLRVEDHENAVNEMTRVLQVHRAYEHMNNGDLAIEKGNMDLAMDEYSAAEEMFPDNLEMKYWHAVTLANQGKVEESLPIFYEVFNKNEDWYTLTPRLIDVKLLDVNNEELQKILNQKK